jgi:CRISPR-associated protein Csd1
VLLRSQIEYEVNHPKAAIIKAILKRNYNTILPMSLDPTITEPAYLLGRLFAVLEHIQSAAHTGRTLNKSIKDGFFGTAARTPAQAFPQLIQRSVHHLGAMKSAGIRIFYEKMLQEVRSQLPAEYPARLSLREQGLYDGGYYHQRNELFDPITSQKRS